MVIAPPVGPKTGFSEFWTWKKNDSGDDEFDIFVTFIFSHIYKDMYSYISETQ